MNPKTESLVKMAQIAYAILQDDEEACVSSETGVANILRLEQIAVDLVAEADPDLDYTPWNAVIVACRNLRNVHRNFVGDLDGEATQALYDTFDPLLA